MRPVPPALNPHYVSLSYSAMLRSVEQGLSQLHLLLLLRFSSHLTLVILLHVGQTLHCDAETLRSRASERAHRGRMKVQSTSHQAKAASCELHEAGIKVQELAGKKEVCSCVMEYIAVVSHVCTRDNTHHVILLPEGSFPDLLSKALGEQR